MLASAAGNSMRALLPWLLATIAALMIFGHDLGREPLWLDESYTFAMVGHTPAQIWELTAEDVHPPLYYVLTWLVRGVFGSSELSLRALSALAGVALVALAGGPVRRIFGERTAYVYALLVLSAPGAIGFAQEARMYSLAALFVTAAVLYGQLALAELRWADFAKLAVSTCAAAYTHHFALLAVALNAALLFAMALRRRRASLRPLSIALGACALAFLPWLPSALKQLGEVAHQFWVPELTWHRFVFAVVAPFTYKFEDLDYPWQAVAAFWGCAAAFAYAVVQRWPASSAVSDRPEPLRALAALGLAFAGTLGVATAFSLWVQPVLMPRYMIPCLGVLLLGAAAGVAALPRVLHSALAVALLVALNLPIDRQILGATFNGPLRELGERVGSDSSALLIHTDVQTPLPSWVQLPRARHVLLFPPEQEAWNPGAGVAEGESLSGSNDLAGVLGAATTSGPQGGPAPVWVVDSRTGAFHVPVWAITSHPGWRQVGPSELLELPLSWLKLDIARFEYTRP